MRTPGPLPKILLAGLTLLALAAAPGCRGCVDRAQGPSDPTSRFQGQGKGKSRDLGLYLAGARVGTMRQEIRRGRWQGTLAGEAFLLDQKAEITVRYQEQTFTVRTVSRIALESKGFALLGAWTEASFGAAPWVVTWERGGEEVFLRSESAGGSTRRDSVRLPPGTIVQEALPFLLGEMAFSPGEARAFELFSLTLRKPVSVTVTLQGESAGVRAFVFTLWAMEEKVWIDETGMVSKESLPFDLEARPPTPGEAAGVLRLEAILNQSAVPGVNTPEFIAEFPRVRYTLEGVSALPVETPWQKVTAVKRGAEVRITRPIPPEGGGTIPPVKPGGDALLNLDSPYLQQVARQAAAGEATPWGRAVAVGKWVYANMGKTMRECTSALDALRAGEGECQSHAVVASALCQALGIPTRFVSGVVYLPQRGSWGFHSWLEVNVGEWIPLDPTLGAFPAGVDHIALVYGNYLEQFQMAPFIFFGDPWRVVYEEERPKDSAPLGGE